MDHNNKSYVLRYVFMHAEGISNLIPLARLRPLRSISAIWQAG